MVFAGSTSRAASRWVEQLPLARRRPVLAVFATLGAVGIGWAARQALDPLLPPGFPFLTFFPVVIVTAFLFGARCGAVAAVLCGLIAWYEFIPPLGFSVAAPTLIALGLYVFVVTTEIALVHWLQRSNRHLAAEREENRSLAETRRLLFHELQHRVSNNLQVAAALLAMQKRQIADASARHALDETARRLQLIGRISRQLYDASGAAQPLLPLIEEIGRSILAASGRDDDIALTCSGDEALRVPSDMVVPAALIIAEAIANSVEHGFPDGQGGRIDVAVTRTGPGVEVVVADDGRGLPDGFDGATSDSLGLRIARMMAEAQGGVFALRQTMRTEARLTLPRVQD